MKKIYKGFEIEAKKEKCMAGYDLCYMTAMRISDGWFLEDRPSEFNVRDAISELKAIVDDYINNPKEYEEIQ